MKRWGLLCGALLVGMGLSAQTQQRGLPIADLKSGTTFMSQDLRSLQADDGINPASLWWLQGERLWQQPAPEGPTCASCHGDGSSRMAGVAARYPRVTPSGRVLNLEAQINRCRTQHQKAPAWAYESEALLAMTAWLAKASRGELQEGTREARAQLSQTASWQRGQAQYHQRIGQMNLACVHCHDQNWGRRLGGETMSQGHPVAFPAYRLEWQGLGSLHRRLRACFSGVRAEPPAFGSQALLDLEVFLAWRAGPLPLEAPGVRR
jgi:sulfur-oxidizing protein SoxA